VCDVCRELSIIHTDFKPENVMLLETLQPRHWEMVVQQPTPAPAAAAAAAGGAPGQQTKNQKKKAKKKAKKAGSAATSSQEVRGTARLSHLSACFGSCCMWSLSARQQHGHPVACHV
jgi:ribosomal protein L12E/L44/L45/RPP1/RPP2